MKSKIKHKDNNELEMAKIIKDFLPRPSELVLKEKIKVQELTADDLRRMAKEAIAEFEEIFFKTNLDKPKRLDIYYKKTREINVSKNK